MHGSSSHDVEWLFRQIFDYLTEKQGTPGYQLSKIEKVVLDSLIKDGGITCYDDLDEEFSAIQSQVVAVDGKPDQAALKDVLLRYAMLLWYDFRPYRY
ncbi:hypothetical protein AB9K36_30200 [Klebsiella michiganensis]|uniref:hypothetical protein n=1 Tax=Klebsiella TaxID=570 RepID=UPI000C7C3276|nr:MULTISPECIES: hypothetical protein [Klebsiella]MCZ9441741.1 hypothetical protein [Klebsiella michiganensis]MDL4454057.1 hypothetical protein [Klebsiella michiganensis]UTJ44335.1 hypothetical protein NLZ17_10385 [Klebsiella grimontii]UYY75245.1 hypothetical protein OKE89_13475 [Klebsiella michiganensis]HCQ7478764.1 hypothetical protein [Klebsiella michiganensis]